jgi:hypothetical protein
MMVRQRSGQHLGAARRLRSMSGQELTWRLRSEVRARTEQAASIFRKPGWRRDDVRRALAVETLPPELQQAVDTGEWMAVHEQLLDVVRRRPSRFVLNPAFAARLQREVRSHWPEAVADAKHRAGEILDGRFDLLGYHGLSFCPSPTESSHITSTTIDWHFDPVHQRRMPMAFWSRVPYLDPTSGDHKVVWELNRQQHWLGLSRALWLTGDRSFARGMVRDFTAWMAANPPLLGVNWASMLELAFRSLSWLWGLHAMLVPGEDEPGHQPWLVDLMMAIDRQLTHVERNLSLYFSPNTHLTGEALALYACGAALPELTASTQWIDTGRRVLLDEIGRQIELDGGHAERSTHYHRYTLDFYLFALLTARCIGDTEAEARFGEAASRLAQFARAMADGQGRLPRIGDDDAGRLWPIAGRDPADIRDSLALAATLLDRREWAPWGTTEEVLWLTSNDRVAFDRAISLRLDDRRIRERRTLTFRAAVRRNSNPEQSSLLAFPDAESRRVTAERRGRVGERRGAAEAGAANRRITRVFADTGYVTSATETGDHLVLDAGPHGYLNGGHAHADALSVVLTLRHRPLLVDPGTPTYTMDLTLRDDSRSSVSHNTVTVDGVSSALPDGPFHWRTQADASVEVLRHNSHFALIEATHDGYRHARHRRTVLATDGGYLFIDAITGEGEHHAAQQWHLDPRWRVECESGRALRLRHESGETAWLLHDRGDVSLVKGDDASPLGWVSPAYGIRVPTWSVGVAHRSRVPFTLVTWCGTFAEAGVPSLERIPSEHDTGASVVATRVRCGSSEWLSIVRAGDALSRPSGTVSVSAVRTDARALQGVFENGVFSSVCLADASHVRIADDLAIDADAVVPDLHVALCGDRLEISASSPPARLRLTGTVLQRITRVAGNGHTLRRLDSAHTAVVLTAPDWSDPVTGVEFQDQHDVRYRRVR